MTTERELLRLKEEIEEAKARKNEAAGTLKMLRQQLKSEFGCKSPKDAKAKLREMSKEIGRLYKEVTADLAKLKKKYKLAK